MQDELFKTLQKQAKHETRFYYFYSKLLLKKRLITVFIRLYPLLFCGASLIIFLVIYALINILKSLF